MKKPILVAEDTETDAFLMQSAVENLEPKPALRFARDGLEAVAYLNGDLPFNDRGQYPLPRIVILDIEMPRLNGLQVLQWIRQHPAHRDLPVIMLTSSKRSSDVKMAYQLGADGYIMKPLGIHSLHGIMRVVNRYWVEAEAPPPNCTEWLSLNLPPPEGMMEQDRHESFRLGDQGERGANFGKTFVFE